MPRGRGLSKKRIEMGKKAWAEYQAERNRDKVRKTRKRVVDCRKRKKARLVAIFGGKCKYCSFDRPWPECFDFHHRDRSKKSFGISDCNRSWEALKREAKRCDLVCATCHRAIHRGRRFMEESHE